MLSRPLPCFFQTTSLVATYAAQAETEQKMTFPMACLLSTHNNTIRISIHKANVLKHE